MEKSELSNSSLYCKVQGIRVAGMSPLSYRLILVRFKLRIVEKYVGSSAEIHVVIKAQAASGQSSRSQKLIRLTSSQLAA